MLVYMYDCVIVNAKLRYMTVNIVRFAHKDDIIGGLISWNDNRSVKLSNTFVIEYRSNFRTHRPT